MKSIAHISFILTVVLLLGCIAPENQEDDSTPGAAPENQTSFSSTSTTTSTTSSTTTTSLSYIGINEKSECSEYNNTIERDNCLLSLGIRTRNTSICESISRLSAKKLCIATIEGEKTGSTTINGYVFNATTQLAIRKIKISAVSNETREVIAVDSTDRDGFYSLTVPSGDTYRIVASAGDKNYTQTQYARNGWTHELWFKLNVYNASEAPG